MLDYTLLLATSASAELTEAVVVSELARVGGPAVADGTLRGQLLPIEGPVSPGLFEEILGRPATARVYFGVKNKGSDQARYEEAQRRVGVVAAAVAAELDAEACLLFELEIVVFRRSKGELVLYDWFSRWRDPEVQAMLPEPFRMTSESGRL